MAKNTVYDRLAKNVTVELKRLREWCRRSHTLDFDKIYCQSMGYITGLRDVGFVTEEEKEELFAYIMLPNLSKRQISDLLKGG